MKRIFLVEPLVAMYAFSFFLILPLVQQYVYRRFWLEVTGTPYPISGNTSRCMENNNSSSSNDSSYHEEVQRLASQFSTYSVIASTIPSLIVTLLLVTHSDRGGRKIAIVMPLIGSVIYTLGLLTVSYFELNVYLLILVSFSSSLFGGLGTFLGGVFAYIADLTKGDREKTLRMGGVETMIGLFSGVASICTGYFLNAAGFNWPFLTSVIFQCLNLAYAIFVLEETVTPSPSDFVPINGSPQRSVWKQIIYGVYDMFTRARGGGQKILVLLTIIFISFAIAYLGALSLVTLYELNEPLCWDAILIGYGAALSTTAFITSYLGLAVLTCCHVPQLVIVALGILSATAGLITLAFAKTTFLMFMVRGPMLLGMMPFPVLRAMLSKIVSTSEQGALFAAISFLENLTTNVATAVFYSIYSATLDWCPGFLFLLSAGLCTIPLIFVGLVSWIGVDVAEEVVVQEAVEEDLVEEREDNGS
ncbi:lysosomal proton-coupled steroid conjugate and bile acid symporter SLC46A3 [Pungitius pungitius]|uniref:lysosomal proton-coupled steroid conjugate and bile acid symporter SLC46A3 n=1 Tax=Pungitius pungitius TaxID=134920 RepID=UPI001886BDC1|nr:lysosomal proton-coupled steroid conjugate and bile acid symporter SLC46A3 [Pungitius pungitius]